MPSKLNVIREKVHAVKCCAIGADYNSTNPLHPENCDCDGYHTFDELYDHRITLYIALCHQIANGENDCDWIWRSKYHSNGELCFGTGTQYILGIGKEKGEQISYHIPIERWEETDFVETLEKAPEWDGHTSDDVIQRLKNL